MFILLVLVQSSLKGISTLSSLWDSLVDLGHHLVHLVGYFLALELPKLLLTVFVLVTGVLPGDRYTSAVDQGVELPALVNCVYCDL